ncbi:U4/U6 small nuclear ribonucleoprotein Prp3 [Taenia crassiceps]|uniref:U4/U6 small nuclear ribonucleoprotein Prp3 n=1 Tax=Taenia crassiceps TaxID=6207 RepID=A0ABR4QQJ8_9CEST
MSGFNSGPAGTSMLPGELSSAKIRELMENAQRTIAERKQSLGLEGIPAKPQLIPQGLIADPETAERARRAAELQARIASKFDSIVKRTEPSPLPQEDPVRKEREQMRNLIFDEHGKTIDALTGEEIHIPQRTPTLRANVRAQKSHTIKESTDGTNSNSALRALTASRYFDPRLSLKGTARPKRALSFYEPGKFIKIGQRLRTKAQLERLQESVAQAAKRTGIASAAKLATIQPKRHVDEASVPDLECYGSPDDNDVGKLINESWITDLIEHPIKIRAPTDLNKPPEIPLLLTKRERKKLRRQNRQEAQKERQERVRLGLEKPPEPKVKLANLMRVLGSEAVQDPSKVEAYVRKQMESRKKAHEAANASRKLTKEQARFKRIRKIREDTSVRTHVAVYRVRDLTNPAHRFKVETNANQLFMTGLVAMHSDCNVIIVEGGPKQQRRFKRLMLHRIKWLENKRGIVESEVANSTHAPCTLVWEGTVKQRAFENMQVKVCPTELFARELFRKRDVEHYWDMAYSGANRILFTHLDLGFHQYSIARHRKMTPEFADLGPHEITLESPRIPYDRCTVKPYRNHMQASRNQTSSPNVTTPNSTAHELNRVVGKMLQSVRENHQVPTALPVPSNDRQLRQTKSRLLRKSCEVTKTPLELKTHLTADNAPNGSAEGVDSANVPYYQPSEAWKKCVRCKKVAIFTQIHDPSEAPRVWDNDLKAKWKRFGIRGGRLQKERGNLSKRSMGANSDLLSEFTAGSVVWAKMSGALRHHLAVAPPLIGIGSQLLNTLAQHCTRVDSLSLMTRSTRVFCASMGFCMSDYGCSVNR